MNKGVLSEQGVKSPNEQRLGGYQMKKGSPVNSQTSTEQGIRGLKSTRGSQLNSDLGIYQTLSLLNNELALSNEQRVSNEGVRGLK